MVDGSIVISVEPVPDTFMPVTSIVSTVVLSDDFLIVILPLSTSTASEKVSTRLASASIPVAPSDGDEEDNVGVPTSAVVKLSVVAPLIEVVLLCWTVWRPV